MYSWKNKLKKIRPLILPILISNIICSGYGMAGSSDLFYTSTKIDPQSFNLSDVIATDGNYSANISVDNPNPALEVYIAQAETDDENYHIGDYFVNIHGNNILSPEGYTAFFGLSAQKNNTISLNNFSFINSLVVGDGHNNSTALLAANGSNITINGKVYINSLVEMDTSGTGTATTANNGLYAKDEGTSITANSGDIYINTYTKNFLELLEHNNTYPEGGAKSDAISGKYGGQVTVNQTGQYRLNVLGNMDLGDDAAEGGGGITAVFNGADSYWHGHEVNFYDTTSNAWVGALDVTLMNKAHWIPDELNAEISALNLQKDGVVNLHGFNLHTNKSQNESVKIYDLKGNNGIFLIDVNTSKTDGQRKNGSDFIEVVSSSTGGSHYIEALNANKFADLSEDIWVADAANNITFKPYEQIDITNEYVYDYKPILRSDIKPGDPASQYGTNWYITKIDKQLSAPSHTVMANASLNYATATARLEIDSLNKRLGELRNDQQENGLWLRYKGGEMKSKHGSYFKNQYHFYQLGYDNKDENEHGIWTKGIAAHYLDGKSEFTYGSGDNKSYGGTIYGSWQRHEKQDYVDLVLKYSHLKNHFDYQNTFGAGGYGAGSNWSWSASAEYGREFSLDNGNFIEPQGQLVYTYINKANYTTSSGLEVNQDNINSVIGRAGVRVGHRFEDNSNNDIYLKADLLHEFAGDRSVTVRGKDTTLTTKQGGDDSWITYGIGTNIQLTKENNSRFYLDVEKSAGGDVNTNWQVNAGLRWEW